MTPEQQREVWDALDGEQLASMARNGPQPVFATISGAHLYGFPSPDSDVDLRGAFLRPVREVLALNPPAETIVVEDKALDLDWVAHDIRKFVRLMTNHNGYVLEQLYSPLVVLTTPAHDALKALGTGCFTRRTVRHYWGFARGRRERLRAPDPTLKHLLYAYRVLLTGIHLMRTGELISNLLVLNERFRLPQLDTLVARKKAGTEKEALASSELAVHAGLLDRLETELQEAHEASQLPEVPTTTAALEALVVRLRLEEWQAQGGRLEP